MSKKHFSWLLIVTLIVAAIILLVPVRTGQESAFEPRPLLPGFREQVNDVALVQIRAAGNHPVITLVRTDDGWVEESRSYPANWQRLKTLMAELAQAQIIELKTRNPEYYERLGVMDVAGEDSNGVLVELGEGDAALTLIVGKTSEEREGQFVRFNDREQSLLIDRVLTVPRQPAEWLESEIVDLAQAEVVEASITYPDGEVVSIRKVSADDTDFSLRDIPEGRETRSAWVVNSIGGMFENLNLEQVVAVDEVDWSEALALQALTADGVEVRAELANAEGQDWLRLEAFTYTGSAEPELQATDVEDETEFSEMTESLVPEETVARVETINQRVGGWAYSITEVQAEKMKKRMEDLLKEQE